MPQAKRTVLVTGGMGGLGETISTKMADQGYKVAVTYSPGNTKHTQWVADMKKAGYDFIAVACDVADIDSCAHAVAEVQAKLGAIDVLVNNAGIAGMEGLTKDGFQITFGTNHLGPWLFTERLLPLVRRAPQGRIVNVSSEANARARGIDWDVLRRPTTNLTALPEYAVSKLCNVLHAKELARRLAHTKVTTYSLHPGRVASDIWGRRLFGIVGVLMRPFLVTNEVGALTQLRCATAPTLAGESGLYYAKEKVADPNPLAHDVALQDELRRRSEAWTV